jgi:hypothetical protein
MPYYPHHVLERYQKLLNYHYEFNYNYRSTQLFYNKAAFTAVLYFISTFIKYTFSVFNQYDDSPLFNPLHLIDI